MKLKETNEDIKEEIKEETDTNSVSSPDGLDGYYISANQSVGNPGFYGNDPSGYTQPSVFDAPYEEPPKKLTKLEFIAREGNRKHRDRITISAIVIYVTAIIGIFAADFLVYDTSGYMSSQIFVSIIMIGLGVGIQMFKSRACAVVGLGGSAINMIAAFTLANRWKEYETTGKCHGVI